MNGLVQRSKAKQSKAKAVSLFDHLVGAGEKRRR
jgi:hypothetical protein